MGGTGTPTTLSVAGEGATNPDVAVDGSGNAQVVWQRFDGSHQRVQERPFSNGATPKPIENLSSPGVDAAVPAIAVSPGGQRRRRLDRSRAATATSASRPLEAPELTDRDPGVAQGPLRGRDRDPPVVEDRRGEHRLGAAVAHSLDQV